MRLILVTSELTGWISTPAIYSVFEYIKSVWPPLVEKIAFVDLNPGTVRHNRFGGKIANAVGLGIAVFADTHEAEAWLGSSALGDR